MILNLFLLPQSDTLTASLVINIREKIKLFSGEIKTVQEATSTIIDDQGNKRNRIDFTKVPTTKKEYGFENAEIKFLLGQMDELEAKKEIPTEKDFLDFQKDLDWRPQRQTGKEERKTRRIK